MPAPPSGELSIYRIESITMADSSTITRQSFRFFHRLRVRWAEVDMQKIVFNGHYLMYFDTAIADYWRALALPYEETMHQLCGDLYVKKATLEYFASARYDDTLDIGLRCGRVGNSSITFTGGIFAGDKLLVTCELVYVYADPVSQTSRPVPQVLRELFAAFEAGEAMTRLVVGDWQALGSDAGRVRKEVFVQEQGIPESEEWDVQDATAVHAVVYNRLNLPLATGRLLVGAARAGRASGQDRPHGGQAGAARLRTWGAACWMPWFSGPQAGATRWCCCTPSAARRAFMPRRGLRNAVRLMTRWALRTSTW